MKYPSAKKLAEMDKKLSKADGPLALPKNASYIDRVKYDLCKFIIIYARTHKITQIELSGRLGLDPARVSEVVNYKISKFKIDTLLDYNRRLNPKFEIRFKATVEF